MLTPTIISILIPVIILIIFLMSAIRILPEQGLAENRGP
jgi:hypothetical protein